MKRCVVPFIKLATVIFIKRNIVGVFTPTSNNHNNNKFNTTSNNNSKDITATAGVIVGENHHSDWNRFRYWLMNKLLPGIYIYICIYIVSVYILCIYIKSIYYNLVYTMCNML